MPTTPTTTYLISDLHIGGDGGLARCQFESELIRFLAEIAARPEPAELIIVGDAFGFWELTAREGVSKLETIAAMHPALFRQLRETGERVTITLLPVRVGHLPGVYVPSYQLNYFELGEADGEIRIRDRVVPKTPPTDLTWLERLLILGRRAQAFPTIPAETRAARVRRGSS